MNEIRKWPCTPAGRVRALCSASSIFSEVKQGGNAERTTWWGPEPVLDPTSRNMEFSKQVLIRFLSVKKHVSEVIKGGLSPSVQIPKIFLPKSQEKHATDKLTQRAMSFLPSPFSICVRISNVSSFPLWMASLLWSMHSFPTRRSSLRLSRASFIIFCFPGIYWIQNVVSHCIPFAGKNTTSVIFQVSTSFLF